MGGMRENLLRTYFLAKDGNRPHLMNRVFAEDAELEMTVKAEGMDFPSRAQSLAGISEVLVRRFGATYDNVYSFYLSGPPADESGWSFACRWLVGMTEKASGAVRTGYGTYDWTFGSTDPVRVERLHIRIDLMLSLPPELAGPVLGWLDRLPYPWCDPGKALAAMPDVQELGEVRAFLA